MVVGTIGFGFFDASVSYRAVTSQTATYKFVPAGVGWRTEPVNALSDNHFDDDYPFSPRVAV